MAKKRKRQNWEQYDENNESHRGETTTIQKPSISGAHHYARKSDLPWDLQVYWRVRHNMFSRYDEGIWMTENAWYEVTPENIAGVIAEHVVTARPDKRPIIVDCFAGVGGNSIAFALTGKFRRVYAIEKDQATLECGRHNAEIYGVAGEITWFHGDCFELLGVNDEGDGSSHSNAIKVLTEVIGPYGLIFASPPWGGPEYKNAGEIFDLNTMPYSLDYIYSRLSKVTKNIVLYLPRTSDLNQITKHVEDGRKAQAIHYCGNGHSKAMCVYFGDWKKIDVEGSP